MEISKLKSILKKKIIISKNIYIIGHNEIDLDAFGAIVGMSYIVKRYLKTPTIIMNDKYLESGVEKAVEKIKDKLNIVKLDAIEAFDDSLLIILDTNKKHLLACKDILDKFTSVIVIDHHETDKETIKNDNNYIDNNISSTCEIVTELIRKFNVKIDANTATLLLSGIVLDTNNFILRADKNTFFHSYYLSKLGASPIEVQYLLKQDINKFITRQKMLTDVTIIDTKIAIAKGVKGEIYRREDLAKIAETLLLFNNIETSFVIANLSKDEIGISGRTLGKMHIGKFMSKLDGGGSSNEGATKIKSNNIKEIEQELINNLKN